MGPSLLYLLHLGALAVSFSNAAKDIPFCGSSQAQNVGPSFRVKEPLSGNSWSENGHGCTCTAVANSKVTLEIQVNFRYEDGSYLSCTKQPMIRWNTFGKMTMYNCASKGNNRHEKTVELAPGATMTFSLHNPLPVKAISEVYIEGGESEFTISCTKDENPPVEYGCACSNGTAIAGGGIGGELEGDDTNYNNRLAVGFGVAIAFLVVVVIASLIWYWLRRRDQKAKEENGKVPAQDGSENTGYNRSKDNLAPQPVHYVSSNPDPTRPQSAGGEGPYANIGEVNNSHPMRRTPSQGSMTISEQEGPVREDAPRKETTNPQEQGELYARPDKMRAEYQNAPVGAQQVGQFMGRGGSRENVHNVSSDREPYISDSSREGPGITLSPRGNVETNI